jgi:hypothetical protein
MTNYTMTDHVVTGHVAQGFRLRVKLRRTTVALAKVIGPA